MADETMGFREKTAVDKPSISARRPPRTTTAIRLPDALHERVVAAAVERDVSINFLVTKAVEQFMDRLIPVDEMRWTRD